MGAEERIYIAPTSTPDKNGNIAAPYIEEGIAKDLVLN